MKNKLSRFILGTSHFGGYVNFKNTEKIILRSYKHGIRKLDTSPMYGENKAENFIGIIKKKHNLRLKIFSKVGLVGFKKNNIFQAKKIPLSSKNITNTVEKSLHNLKIDCLDLLQLHYFDSKTPIEETISTIIELIKLGKIKNYGICNYYPNELKKLFNFLNKNKKKKPYSSQIHYNLIERKAETDLIPILKKNNTKIFANRVFSMGILSGQYVKLNKYPIESRANKSKRIFKYITKRNISISKILNSISEKINTETINLSIKWLEENDSINNPIIGINKMNYIKNFYTYNKNLKKKIDILEIEEKLKKFNKSIMSSPKKYLIL